MQVLVIDPCIANSAMTVAPLIYPIPPLLGYLLFVGISGRFDPLSRPRRRADRPSWLLGLWTGLAVTLVLGAGLVAVHGQPLGGARALLAPSGWTLAALMLPGLALWHAYRGRIVRDDVARLSDEDGVSVAIENQPEEHDERDRSVETPGPSGFAHESSPPVAAFLGRIAPGQVDVPDIPVAPSELADPLGRRDADDAHAPDRGEPGASFTPDEVSSGAALREERRLRAEIEKHLCITRRALRVLSGESGRSERERLDALVALEQELEGRVRERVATETALERQTARCAELERKLAKTSRDSLSARHAVRRGNEARARAVGAATRSLTLARQAIRTRAQAEERLRESEETLAARQATIDSLLSALERAKSRSRNTPSGAVRDAADRAASVATAPVFRGKGKDAADALALVAPGRPGARLARKASRVRPLTSRG